MAWLLLIVLITLPACRASPEGVAGVGRAIQNKGSDTLVNLALAWAEQYREVEPDVSIAVTGGGKPVRKVRFTVSAAVAGSEAAATPPAIAAIVAAPSKRLRLTIIFLLPGTKIVAVRFLSFGKTAAIR